MLVEPHSDTLFRRTRPRPTVQLPPGEVDNVPFLCGLYKKMRRQKQCKPGNVASYDVCLFGAE